MIQKSASKLRGALIASPFVGLSILCLIAIDTPKMMRHQQPYLESRKIEWSGGSIPINPRFHYVGFLDEMWRGTTVTFSPSTLGYDRISSWQMFSFLNDLGPLYATWFLESSRPGNAGSPAYLPSIFTFLGQLLGIGPIAPFFYFLCLTFGPSASELTRSAQKTRLVPEHCTALLPAILVLHTAEVFLAYTAADPHTRHYWTWAWQMTPVYIGVANLVISWFFSGKMVRLASPKVLLGVTCTISTAVWMYTAMSSEYSLSMIFLPDMSVQSEFVPHTRRALQMDEIYVFASSFLWLAYQFFDLHLAGLTGNDWLIPVAVLPVASVLVGPGTAFTVGWFWRESILERKRSME